MDSPLRVQLIVMSSGERHSVLIDRVSGLPVFAPNLFLTSQVRSASLSHASVSAYASCLVVLYRFCLERDIHLESRFRNAQFFSEAELDALRDFCKSNFDNRDHSTQCLSDKIKPSVSNKRWVAKATHYRRLSVAATYFSWLAKQQLDHLQEEPVGLAAMVAAIRGRRPLSKGRNTGLIDRALSDKEATCLLEAIEVASPKNPFDSSVRERNRLVILLEYELGIRGGELLNLRVEDFDFACSTLKIVRRADQADDTRSHQPLVKTNDRELPVSSWLMAEVHRYILNDRNKVPGSKRCPYLFVTHKSGPTQGQPLSIAGYNKLWARLQIQIPALSGATGHRLRHTWNNRFSKNNDEGLFNLSEAEEQAARSVLMGWKQGSGSARRYNQRFIVEKANEASLHLQRQSALRRNQDD